MGILSYNYRINARIDPGDTERQNMFKIFIDGQEGTTGLKIHTRLENRKDVEMISIDPEKRKDLQARLERIHQADITFLCLPDFAAREIASLVSPDKRLIDSSTAHRTEEDWVYGLPEWSADQRERIRRSNRVAVPGCHATGFISIVHPLISEGILDKDAFLMCQSITGYSGGGKQMIQEYEEKKGDNLNAPGIYGLVQHHKHLPEMKKMTGIHLAPAFIPVVSNYYSGMLSTIPIAKRDLLKQTTMEEIKQLYENYYSGEKMVHLVREGYQDERGMICANALSDRDDLEIYVYGNEERMVISARYDNLGKGASGAAVQCMNIMLGMEETTCLMKGWEHE